MLGERLDLLTAFGLESMRNYENLAGCRIDTWFWDLAPHGGIMS